MTVLMRQLKTGLMVLLAMLLVACGGGDSNVPVVGISANSLAVAMSTTSVTGSNPASVTATVRTPTGTGVAGVTVNFKTQIGELEYNGVKGSTMSVQTTSTGQTPPILLKAGSVAGPGSLIIWFTDSEGNQRRVTQAFQTDGTGSGTSTPTSGQLTLTLTLTDATNQSVGTTANPISSAKPARVKAVLARDGVALTNQVISFQTTLGVLNPSSGTALTDAAGAAYIDLRAGTTAGAGSLKANFVSNEGTASASVNFQTLGDDQDAGPINTGLKMVLNIRNQADTLNVTKVTGSEPVLLKACLTDGQGVPQEQKVITFTTTLGTLNPVDGTALTDVAGCAKVNLSAGTQGGAGVAKASYGAASAEKGFETDGSGGGSQGSLTVLGLFDADNPTQALANNTVTSSKAGLFRVQVRDVSSAPLVNQIVTVSSDVGVLTPSTGKVLTDSQGVAQVNISAGESNGAGTLTAVTALGSTILTSRLNFTVSQDVIDIGRGTGVTFEKSKLEVSALTVAAGSTLTVKAYLVNASAANAPWYGLVNIQFASTCSQAAKATIDATVTPQNGVAVAAYKPAAGCTADTITAQTTLNGVQKSAVSSQITVTQSPANSIEFVGANPKVIGLQGSAQVGIPDVSTLTFRVKDSNGQPVAAGVKLKFFQDSTVGGYKLNQSEAQTDSNGEASVTVASGTVPTVATIRAELESNPAIKSYGTVSINTGIATQDRFRTAVATSNPFAGNHLGKTVQVTVRAADRYGNYVPDGTKINFSAELGDIDPVCNTQGGGCTVTWTSQGSSQQRFDSSRAGRDCSTLSAIRKDAQGVVNTVNCGVHDRFGRNVITAWTAGEETFVDSNGDNVFDATEGFEALPDAFRDDNETGLWGNADNTANSFLKDYWKLNQATGSYTGAGTKFKGVLCSDAAKAAGHCASLTNVRRSVLLVMSTDQSQAYVFGPNVIGNPAQGIWQAAGGGSPTQWGTAKLRGLTTVADLLYTGVGGDGGGQLTAIDYSQLLVDGSAQIDVIVADMNGNAPGAGTKIEFQSGALKAVGATSYTVTNATEQVLVSFRVTRPDSPPDNPYQPLSIKVTSNEVVTPVSISVVP